MQSSSHLERSHGTCTLNDFTLRSSAIGFNDHIIHRHVPFRLDSEPIDLNKYISLLLSDLAFNG